MILFIHCNSTDIFTGGERVERADGATLDTQKHRVVESNERAALTVELHLVYVRKWRSTEEDRCLTGDRVD